MISTGSQECLSTNAIGTVDMHISNADAVGEIWAEATPEVARQSGEMEVSFDLGRASQLLAGVSPIAGPSNQRLYSLQERADVIVSCFVSCNEDFIFFF